MGVDGIKTGYLAYEKYSLASSMDRNGRRLIAVASGFETKNLRSKESAKLLTYGITNFDTIEISKKNSTISNADIWLGKKNSVDLYVDKDIYKTIPKGRKKYLKVIAEFEGPLEAPISKGQEVGILNVYFKDELLNQYKLYAKEDVKKLHLGEGVNALEVRWINTGRVEGRAAKQAGLKKGDIIVGMENKPLRLNSQQFNLHVKLNYEVGEKLPLTLLRNGKSIQFNWPLTDGN